MTEQEIIQEIARRAELTQDAATRAYKAMQSITEINHNKKESVYSDSSLQAARKHPTFNLAMI